MTAQSRRKGAAQTPRRLTGHCKKASMHLAVQKYPPVVGAYSPSLAQTRLKCTSCAFYHQRIFFHRVHVRSFFKHLTAPPQRPTGAYKVLPRFLASETLLCVRKRFVMHPEENRKRRGNGHDVHSGISEPGMANMCRPPHRFSPVRCIEAFPQCPNRHHVA